MVSANYYRRQAELCADLARSTATATAADRFKRLGLEMLAKARAIDDGSQPPTPRDPKPAHRELAE